MLRRAVEVLRPALGLVDGRARLDPGEQGLGVEWHGGLEVHARGVLVLLEAGVHGHPGVAGLVDGPAAGDVVDVGLDPDVLQLEGGYPAAFGHSGDGDAALGEQAVGGLGGLDAADPVHGLRRRDLDGAVGVAGGDAGGAEERDEQAGGVEGVAAPGLQGEVRALDGAVGGQEFDGVPDPVVDFDGVVVQGGGLGPDGLGDLHVLGPGEVLGRRRGARAGVGGGGEQAWGQRGGGDLGRLGGAEEIVELLLALPGGRA